MFARKGDKTPELRFSGFAENWEQCKVSDLFDLLQNNTLSRAELSFEDGVAKNVHYGDVLVKFGEYLNVSQADLPYIVTQHIVDKLKGSLLQNGDIVMADTAEDETVGKCSEISGIQTIPIIAGLHMAHRLIGYGTIADGTDNVLKVMRSYQYHAAYKIYTQVVKRTDWDDSQQKGGYIYHTTGSGKTMTSFKCAQLIKSSGKVEKIVFLMDRDELWKQTYDNYRNFSDCDDIEDTANTNSLLSKLENDTPNLLIVTSIHKMSNLTTVEPTPNAARIAKVQKKKLVFIIDEAHRSTFGTMLRDIKLTYPKAMFFGFTGTPILDVNAVDGITTDGLFGECLHKYTITEGIRDKNVLGFKPSKVVTFDEEDFREKIALSKIGKACVTDLTDDEYAKFHALVSRDMIEVEADVGNALYSDDDTGEAHRKSVVSDILSKWDRIS